MINPVRLYYGADPELFLKRDGRIIGSEKVVPIMGVGGCVIRDGVQVELNPPASNSVRTLGERLAHAMFLLRSILENPHHKGVEVCWEGTVEVSEEELASLSSASRRLGCAPSENVYGLKPITVDPLTYRKRSAGGHLHIGMGGLPELYNRGAGIDERPNIVPLLDIFVGNTAVLLDRDPNAAERRENYGRAGEHRRPHHGLEYRTPSNFWLRSYTLLSLMFGLANFAVSIAAHCKYNGDQLENDILKAISIDNVVKAIDTNDFELAKSNFQSLIPFMYDNMQEAAFGIRRTGLEAFVGFAETVRENKGCEPFFERDVIKGWQDRKFVDFTEFL